MKVNHLGDLELFGRTLARGPKEFGQVTSRQELVWTLPVLSFNK